MNGLVNRSFRVAFAFETLAFFFFSALLFSCGEIVNGVFVSLNSHLIPGNETLASARKMTKEDKKNETISILI